MDMQFGFIKKIASLGGIGLFVSSCSSPAAYDIDFIKSQPPAVTQVVSQNNLELAACIERTARAAYRGLKPTLTTVPGPGYVEVRHSVSGAYTGTWYGFVVVLNSIGADKTRAEIMLGAFKPDNEIVISAFNSCI